MTLASEPAHRQAVRIAVPGGAWPPGSRRRSTNPIGRRLCATLLIGLTALVPMTAGASGDGAAVNQRTLAFGFLPIVSPAHLVRRFSPLVEYLGQQLGMEVRIETAPDFAEFLRRTQTGHRYDILFTAPHFYYLAQHAAGYRALVRVGRPRMRAVIVVPRRRAIHSLADLRGHRLATTDPMSLATVLVRASLTRAGVDPDRDLTLVATPTHNAALLSAYQGRTDGAALMLPLFRQAAPEVVRSMRIIAETGSSPHMPISVAPWIDAALAAHIRTILLNMPGTQPGRKILKDLNWPGFRAAGPHDYDGLARIARQLAPE